MVSSGTVSGDLSSVESGFSSYSSATSSLGSNWQGPSYDNFIGQAEDFLGEFKATISGEMSAFADACSAYEQYIQAYNNQKTAEGNVAEAIRVKDASAQSSWEGKVTEYRTAKEGFAEQIKASLVAASSSKLNATALSGSSVSSSKGDTTQSAKAYNGKVNSTMQNVADVASTNSGGGYDNMCEAWAEVQWENATGIGRQPQPSAYDAWQNFGVSTSKDNIPVGAMVYGSGSPTVDSVNNPYGHVGIYVGNGMVADQGGVVNMDTWLSWQNANCDGHTGWIGWGWQNGVDLTKA